jgi:hypothetical protein
MVLSGAGAHVPSSILHKELPAAGLAIRLLVRRIICDYPKEPTETHPFMTLVATWFDDADPVNFGRHLTETTGGAGRHAFALLGTQDKYSPPQTNRAMVTATLLQQMQPELSPVVGRSLLALRYPAAGYGTLLGTLSGNLTVGGQPVTAGFRQYHEDSCLDDHYIYQCSPAANSDWLEFLGSALKGVPTVD